MTIIDKGDEFIKNYLNTRAEDEICRVARLTTVQRWTAEFIVADLSGTLDDHYYVIKDRTGKPGAIIHKNTFNHKMNSKERPYTIIINSETTKKAIDGVFK